MVRLALLAVLMGTVSCAANVSIQFDGVIFRVIGWNAVAEPADGWDAVFRIYAGKGDSQPMLGSYEVRDRVLAFRPRFPIAAGVRYHAIFEAPGTQRVEANFDGPPSHTNPLTRVDRVYP